MSKRAITSRDIDDAMAHWLAKASAAAFNFERRWTRAALDRVDSELSYKLRQQQGMFDTACMFGGVHDIETHGGGLCRGWQSAVKTMEANLVPDDAYMLGSDAVSGVKVAVGNQKPSAERVVELLGQDIIWVTPDEVAVLIAGTEQGKAAGAAKKLWPGAEIIRAERYGSEGS